jgi:hypothetical protein
VAALVTGAAGAIPPFAASSLGSGALVLGALSALAALWIWEHGWLRAGQSVPLS